MTALPSPSPELALEQEPSAGGMEAGLVLGDDAEFQLTKVVSQLLYAHQVCRVEPNAIASTLARSMQCDKASCSSELACRWML